MNILAYTNYAKIGFTLMFSCMYICLLIIYPAPCPPLFPADFFFPISFLSTLPPCFVVSVNLLRVTGP